MKNNENVKSWMFRNMKIRKFKNLNSNFVRLRMMMNEAKKSEFRWPCPFCGI